MIIRGLPHAQGRRLATRLLLGIVVMFGLLTVCAQQPAWAANPVATYTYDADGRLATVENASGQIATYQYDEVGNVVAITRSTAAKTADALHATIATFAPRGGAPTIRAISRRRVRGGRHFTITGSGFAPDAEADIVRVGPLLATVLTASRNRLVVAAPPDQGGAVTVTTPAGESNARRIIVLGTRLRTISRSQTVRDPLRAPPGITALSGQIETNRGTPLQGVTVSITTAWGRKSVSTTSNATGHFLLEDLSTGSHALTIDASHLAGGQDFGIYSEPVQLPEGRTTVLPWMTYLTRIDGSRVIHVGDPTTRRIVLTSPQLPGVKVVIPRGTVIRDHLGHVVHALSITRLPTNRTPFPWGTGMVAPFFTIQPGDATVSGAGLEIVYPNTAHRSPGSPIPYLAENPRWPGTGWYRYGTGHVTRDGRSIIPDPRTRYFTTDPGGDPTTGAPGEGPPAGGQCQCGDPVDLSTGLFVDQTTDISLPDIEGVTLDRVFRPLDDTVRDFGLGDSDSLDLYLVPASSGDEELILPDGGGVTYTPTPTSNVYQSVNTPTNYSGSTLVLDGGGDIYGPWTLTLRNGTQMSFGNPAYLMAITDRFGNTVTINRASDGSGDIQSVTTPSGRWLQFTWGTCIAASATQCITRVSDNAGRTVSYTYDSSGRLAKVTNVNGGSTTFAWAACNDSVTCTELTSITDPAGRVTKISYNTNGQVTQQTQPNGGIWKYQYAMNSSGAITRTIVTDPRGQESSTGVGADGYSTSNTVGYVTSSAETTTSTYYAGTGLLESTTDPLGRKTTYTYDALGNPLTITSLAGTANAAATTYTYEPKYNRIASVTDPLGHKTVYAYNDTTNVETITDPLGRQTVVTYNRHGQTVSSRDPLDGTTYYSYLSGDLVAVANPLGQVSATSYDAVGRPLEVTDPAGNTTSYTYDAAGDKLTSTDPYGHTTKFAYNADGELTSVTDANGNKTLYTRDALGDVTKETDALGKSATWTYDADGNPLTNTDRDGNLTTYAYDSLGRLTTTDYGVSGSTVKQSDTTTYDLGNRPTKVVDSLTGTYSYSYDSLDDLLTAATPQGSLAYTYNLIGQRTGMTVPGQSATAYTYDADGELTKLTQGTTAASYAYDKDGRLSQVTLPNGVIQTNTYNGGSELTGSTVVNASLTSVGSVAYTYDPDGRTATANGSLATLTMPAAASSETYNADNELTKYGSTSLTYDANGNLTSDGTNTYTWNALNQLASGTTASATYSYTYDPSGDRISSTSGTTTTASLYDAGTLVQQSTGGTVTGNYLGTGPGGTVQVSNSTGTFSPLINQTGSTTNLTTAAGKIATTFTYDPAGKTSTSGTANPDPEQFSTGQTDPTGLVLMGARYYDPALGRFISQDPLGLASGSPNLYEYAGDDPVTFNDPSGLCGGFLSCLGEGSVDFLAGAANGLTGGIFNIQPPFCGPGLNWAYDAGNVAGFVGGFFVGDEVLDAVGGGLRIAEDADVGVDLASEEADAVAGEDGAGDLGELGGVCGGQSFSASTRVVLAGGRRVALDKVRVGDKVLATDPTTAKSVAERVRAVWVDHDSDLLDLTVRTRAGDSVVQTTRHHLFYDITTRGWKQAERLHAGEHLYTADRALATVVATRVIAGSAEMWDLTVARDHDFYVTTGGSTTLVHNCPVTEDAGGSQLRHYTTDEGAEGIQATGTIRPSADGNTYLTPDHYADGPGARAGLNLSHTPTGYFELPAPTGAPAPIPVEGGTGAEVPVPGPVTLPPGTPFNPF